MGEANAAQRLPLANQVSHTHGDTIRAASRCWLAIRQTLSCEEASVYGHRLVIGKYIGYKSSS